jgi:hypothetical protein
MMTVEEQREAEERNRLIEQLRAARSEAAKKLQAIDDKLQAAEDGDFLANLGRKELAQMTLKERAMVAAKLGHERFAALVTGRR